MEPNFMCFKHLDTEEEVSLEEDYDRFRDDELHRLEEAVIELISCFPANKRSWFHNRIDHFLKVVKNEFEDGMGVQIELRKIDDTELKREVKEE